MRQNRTNASCVSGKWKYTPNLVWEKLMRQNPFAGWGGYAGIGSNQSSWPGNVPTTGAVGGGYAGFGGGAFFTNANSAKQLCGPFKTYTLNLPGFSAQFAIGGGTWIFSGTVGPSIGAAASSYSTTTTWATP